MMNRYWIIGTVFAVVALAALGWLLGIQPKLQEATAADFSRSQVEAQNQAYEISLADLREQFENIEELRTEVDDLRESIPSDADYAGFVAELNQMASSSGVGIKSLTVSEATWYTSTPAVEEAPPTGEAVDSEQTTGEAETPAEAPEDPAAPIPVPTSSDLVNGSNFVAIPVQIQLTGDEAGYLAMLASLQSAHRLFLVTGFSWGGEAPATIDGLLYVLLSEAH
jgi:hypothetical protein